MVTSGAFVVGGGGGGGAGGVGGGAAVETVSDEEAEWLIPPLVPVNTIAAVAAVALGKAANTMLCGCPADSVRDAGVAVTPDGSPLTETATEPLNEFTAAAETFTCAPAPPAWMVTVPGDAAKEKSGLVVGVVLALLVVYDAHESNNVALPRHVAAIRSRIRRSRIVGPSSRR